MAIRQISSFKIHICFLHLHYILLKVINLTYFFYPQSETQYWRYSSNFSSKRFFCFSSFIDPEDFMIFLLISNFFYFSLLQDTSVNVRLKFCKALPLIKSQLKLPCDRLLLQMLEQTVRRIMALESDTNVSDTIRNVICLIGQCWINLSIGLTYSLGIIFFSLYFCR